MKTLYLGYYDYSFSACAYIIKNNRFIEYNLTYEELDDFHNLIYFTKDTEIKERLSKYFKEFDKIIACDDGSYYLLKGE